MAEKSDFSVWVTGLGRRCREIREDLGKTQSEFTKTLRIDSDNNMVLSRFERGSVRLNSQVLCGLIDIAKSNSYSLTWLITGGGCKFEQRHAGGLGNVSDDDLMREIVRRKLLGKVTDFVDTMLEKFELDLKGQP